MSRTAGRAQRTTNDIAWPYRLPSSHCTFTTVAGGLAKVREIEKGSVEPGGTSIGTLKGTLTVRASCSSRGDTIASRAVSRPTLRSSQPSGPTFSRCHCTGGAAGAASAGESTGAAFNRSTRASRVSTCFADEDRVASTAKANAFVASSRALSAFTFARYVKKAMTSVAMTPNPVSHTIHQSAAEARAYIAAAVGVGVGFTPRTLSAVAA